MKPKKNVSISQAMLVCADAIIAFRRFDDFSELVSALIREEYERRGLSGPPGTPDPGELMRTFSKGNQLNETAAAATGSYRRQKK